MKVCMVVSEFPPDCAGLGSYVYNLSSELVKNGNEVTVLTRGNYKSNIYQKIDGIDVFRVRFFSFPPAHIKIHGYFLNDFFSRFLKDKNFDIIHYHSPLVPTIDVCIPSIATVHSCWKTEAKLYTNIANIYSLYVKMFNKFFSYLELKSLKHVDKITSVSDSIAEDLSTYYGADKEKITVIKNGVNEELFRYNVADRKKNNILYTGRLVYGKGLLDLIKSAKYVCEKYPDISFIIAGEGPLKSKMQRMIKGLKLENNFSFLGFIKEDELTGHYQNDSIYVLPSYKEGLPTVILEAMSSGMPVIATDVSGNNEIIVDNHNGLLVPAREPKLLSNAIIRLLEDEDLRLKLGENGRKYINEFYTWNNIAKNVLKLYNGII